MTDKKTFILYKTWSAPIQAMTDEQAGQLLKAIYSLENGNEIPPTDPGVAIIWVLIKETLVKDDNAYLETLEDKRNAGKQGGLKSGEARRKRRKQKEAHASKSEANEAPASYASENEANEADNDTVNDTDTVYTSNPFTVKKESTVFLKGGYNAHACAQYPTLNTQPSITNQMLDQINDPAEMFQDPRMGDEIKKWIDVRSKLPRPYGPAAVSSTLNFAKKYERKYGAKACIDLIEACIAKGSDEIYWDRLDRQRARSGTTRQQRSEENDDFLRGVINGTIDIHQGEEGTA